MGYTRASALGPIAEFVEIRGGSIERIFANVDLPLGLLDNPDLPLPLQEQFKVLSAAGRDIGDPFFGAALGRVVSMESLSAFGRWLGSAPSLASLIDRCQHGLNRYLQTATRLRFEAMGAQASWSIEFLDPGGDGRFQNELLGVSYLIDGVRYFVGDGWSPRLIRSTCSGPEEAASLEKVFGAPVQANARVTSIEFDICLLTATRNGLPEPDVGDEIPIPAGVGIGEDVAALSAIALLEGYPKIDWVADKLGKSRRSLQRALEAEGHTFSALLDGLLQDRASAFLRGTQLPLTEIALRLGYSDAAHFSRAFRRWTGMSPSSYRAAFSQTR